MKKTIMVVMSIIILLLTIISISFLIFKHSNTTNNNEGTEECKGFELVKIDMEKAKQTLTEGEKSKCIRSVNGESITQLDINYQKLINENSNSVKNEEELIEQCVRNKVVLQEATKQGISINQEEKDIVQNYYSQTYTEKDEEIANNLGMNKEEYIQASINEIINNRNIVEFHNKIYMKILKDELAVENESFKEHIKQAKNEENDSEKIALYEKAYNDYVDYLVENSTITN